MRFEGTTRGHSVWYARRPRWSHASKVAIVMVSNFECSANWHGFRFVSAITTVP